MFFGIFQLVVKIFFFELELFIRHVKYLVFVTWIYIIMAAATSLLGIVFLCHSLVNFW